MDAVAIVGTFAAIASVASFFPQAWKIIKTRDVEGLSSGMYALTASAFALWLTYGLLQGQWALIIPNALCLAVAAFILMMVMLPGRKRAQVADVLDPEVHD